VFRRKPLGEILVEMEAVTPEQVDRALEVQADKGGRIGEILIGIKACDEGAMLQGLARQLSLPFLDKIDADAINPAIVAPLSINYAKQHSVLPLDDADGLLQVATTDPLNTWALDDLQTLYGKEVSIRVTPSTVLLGAINKIFDRRANADQLVDELADDDPERAANDLLGDVDILDQDDEAPIIRLVNSILNQAVKERASDIHIEPFEKFVSVRFRRDGVLHEIVRPQKRYQASITSRIKIMGELNIAEKRLPQDGRIRIKVGGRDVDIRLSTIPTSHGERLVLRLLDKTSTVLDLEQLGFGADNLEKFEVLIRKPHGIILVTGPTGSGKTTTLYAALSRINSPDKNILTIEDPVEYQLEGIGQMQVNPKIHFTFASGLRATLRQDPDVVLVGEIRDMETAEIAVQASLTGHLVFSTVHTNDSASTFTRLIDMGVEPFLIASSVLACMAQRLLRRVCKHCRQQYPATEHELEQLNMIGPENRFEKVLAKMYPSGQRPLFYRAVGCKECGMTGYAGRSAIYELLIVNDEIRPLVVKGVDSTVIKKKAVSQGMRTLVDDGGLKVLAGVTTVEEVFRVASSSDEVF
jgi:general secretion pathway protein E